MKIINYTEFINENFQDPPEEYIKTALLKLKKNIETMFEQASGSSENVEEDESGPVGLEEGAEEAEESSEDNPEEVMTFKKALEKGEEKGSKDGLNLSELGAKLESCELSRYSTQYDSLTIKFSDQEGWYNVFLTIPLEGVIEDMKENEEGDYSDKDIKDCSIKFKKYNVDNELVGQLGPTKYKMSEIDETFFVNLKIEVDDEYGESEEFEIET